GLERRYRRRRGTRRDGRGGVRELIRAAAGPRRLVPRLDDARSAVRGGAREERRASPCLPVPSRAVGRIWRGPARALARRSEERARSGPRRLRPGTVATGRPLPRRTGWPGSEGGAVPASPGRGGSGVTGGAVRV